VSIGWSAHEIQACEALAVLESILIAGTASAEELCKVHGCSILEDLWRGGTRQDGRPRGDVLPHRLRLS